jgi:DNA-binding XRE family transcriptional regulator
MHNQKNKETHYRESRTFEFITTISTESSVNKEKKDIRVVHVLERIRDIRVSKNISVEDLAGRANLSRSYIYYIETKKKIPTVTVLFRLADALEVPIEDFFSS